MVEVTVSEVCRAVLGLPFLLPVLFWCWYQWKYRRLLSAVCKLPTLVYCLPVFGHLPYLAYGLSGLINAGIRMGKRTVAQNIRTACLWIGPYPVTVIMDPDDIHTLVTSPKSAEKSSEYSLFNFALGNGLLIAPGSIHKVTRRHVNPLFHPRNLQQLTSVFNESARHLVQDLSKHVGSGHVDILQYVTKTSLRNITCVLFGPTVPIDSNSEEFKKLLKAIDDITKIMFHRTLKPWLWPDVVFRYLWKKEIDAFNSSWKRFAEGHLKVLYSDHTITKSHQNGVLGSKTPNGTHHVPSDGLYNNKTTRKSDQNGIPGAKSSKATRVLVEECKREVTLMDTYNTLRQENPLFTDQDLYNEMITLAITGTDSSKTAISSCMLALAANLDVQERLYQEIVSVLGTEDKDKEVTPEDINFMPYLDQVFKETLRFFTVIPFIARRITGDLQLKDVKVSAGATVAVFLMGLHYDPLVFPNPRNFDPNRFAPENAAKLKRYTFLPFSGGSRNCIGKTYASMFIKTAIVHVLRNYRLATTVDIRRLQYSVALAIVSTDGYHLELHPRS